MSDVQHPMPSGWRAAAGPVVTAFVDAINAFDGRALIDLFDDGAFVNDQLRDFWGKDSIAQWLKTDVIAQRFTMEVQNVHTHFGDVIVNAHVAGNFDNAGLPKPMVHNFHFTLKEHKIVRLLILLAVSEDEPPQVRVAPR